MVPGGGRSVATDGGDVQCQQLGMSFLLGAVRKNGCVSENGKMSCYQGQWYYPFFRTLIPGMKNTILTYTILVPWYMNISGNIRDNGIYIYIFTLKWY